MPRYFPNCLRQRVGAIIWTLNVRTAQGPSAFSGRRSVIATASLIRSGCKAACSPFQRIHSGSRDSAPAASSSSHQLVI